jgi:polyhydroxybutyrate depolymerase
MKVFKIVLALLAVVVLTLAGLFYYWFHVPVTVEPPLAGEFGHTTLEVDKQARTLHWYKPESFKQGAPVIFVLHGSRGSGEQIRAASGYEFDLLAERYGFMVVYPDGYQNHWNDCRRSADYSANRENIDDVAFFKAMIEYLSAEAQIDNKRVFVTGISNGGHMAYRLALEVPDLFLAHAPIAANLPVDRNLDCEKSGQPVSMAIFNGTADPVNPFEGGVVEILGNTSRGKVLSTWETAGYWVGLTGSPRVESSREFSELDGLTQTSVSEQRWVGEGGKQVGLYTLSGSGHVIPSKIARFPRILGEGAGDISGPEEVVGFFLSLPPE